MIQILTYTGEETEYQNIDVKVNSFHDAESLDFFEINIIVLQDEDIWVYSGNTNDVIDGKADFSSLSKMIYNSNKAKNIILLPQNDIFHFDYYSRSMGYSSSGYHRSCELKNMLPKLKAILKDLYIPLGFIEIVYENTKTILEGGEVTAAFYFNQQVYNGEGIDVLTKSVKSEKSTTIKVGNVILSTLLLENYEKIGAFLKSIGLIKQEQRRPEWMEKINMFDDERQMEIIQENEQLIIQHRKSISDAQSVLDRNKRYKSILYTNGDELVEVVFEILEEMLGCDLSEFYDKKKEDFNFKIGEKIFIGEIKGVTPNVKKANVSQLDVHVQEFLDENEVVEANIVALLIINHQRNKPLKEREQVMEEQIKLAERNGSLIVETITLLKLFEQYLSREKSREECIDILQNNTGLLRI